MRYRGCTQKVPILVGGKKVNLDSKLELFVYRLLVKKNEEKEIKIHHPVTICPENEYFSRQVWKVDFLIVKNELIEHLVEAKGVFDESFRARIMLLSHFRPDLLERLTVVTYPKVKLPRWAKSIKVLSLTEFDKSVT